MSYTTNYSTEDYNLVMELRKKGLGVIKIHNQLIKLNKSLNKSTISRWIYRNAKPFQITIVNQLKENYNLLNETKAYLLGVLCGDGYVSTGYRIGLNVCDLDFAEKFKECIYKIYGITCNIRKKENIKTNFGYGKPRYDITLCSKNAWLDLLNYTSFKTKEWKVPEEILESKDLEIKAAFIRGIFDSEGTIRLRRKGFACLQVCSGNIKPLLVIKDILEKDFDINMHTEFRKNLLVLHAYSYKDIKNFSDKIGFVIGRKRKILEYALSTYKRKGLRHYNQEFKLKVFSLLDQGFSASKIGKLLDFNRTNVYDFIKQRGKIENENI